LRYPQRIFSPIFRRMWPNRLFDVRFFLEGFLSPIKYCLCTTSLVLRLLIHESTRFYKSFKIGRNLSLTRRFSLICIFLQPKSCNIYLNLKRLKFGTNSIVFKQCRGLLLPIFFSIDLTKTSRKIPFSMFLLSVIGQLVITGQLHSINQNIGKL